jgi:type II secretory pathway pseudopilin PulG
MRNALKNKKGMTLIEIIVGSLLFTLLVATVFTVLSPMMLAYSRANSLAEYNMVLDEVGNRIISDMAQASAVTPGTDTLGLTINSVQVTYSIGVADGLLYRQTGTDPIPVFHPDFYRGKQVNFTVTGASPNFTLAVTIDSPSGGRGVSGATITREYAVRPLLMVK